MQVLSQRVLNRTLLERQLLTRRAACSALTAIEHLVAVQGQEANWPYVGLWTRLEDFRQAELTALLHGRQVVRAGLIRRTKHLVSAADFRWLRPLVQPALTRAPRLGLYGRANAGLDLDALAEAGRELLAGTTLTGRQLGRLLAERFPGRDPIVLVGSMQFLVTLAAFGPASVRDMQAWSGVTRLGGAVDGLRPRLRVFHDELGRELFDVPDGPLAAADLPVPVRFLPAYDNILLGHADRTRVIADADRRLVMPGQALVRPTFLVDGFVRGTWSVDRGAVRVCPFRPLSTAEAAEVEQEADAVRAFVARHNT